MPKKIKNYIGEVFNWLTVVKETEKRNNLRCFLVKCICGNEKVMCLPNLKRAKSCGCYGKHGGSGTRIHVIWENMKQRCNNPNHTAYKNYGALGVKLCEKWNDFVSFREWALANGYEENLTIDRIDGTLGYFPENCRWVSSQVQAVNKRARGGSSKYIGVCFFKRANKWLSYITVEKKRVHLGYFLTDKEAALARDNYIKENDLKDYVLNGV